MPNYLDVAKSWLKESFDEQTRTEVKALMDGDPKVLEDAFYRTLEFGTGGLRGIMGVGTNRMNRYTVGMATQGLANYLKQCFKNEEISVVISYDCRNNSQYFAEITSKVLIANGIKVYLFDGIRPTPELSFAIRYLKCNSGVMVTASHNPKEYNGYKVFWSDGGQIVEPHDVNIVNEVNKITDPQQVLISEDGKPQMIGTEVDEAYLGSVLTSLVSPASIERHSDLKIAYTPLHGTGVRLVPEALGRIGFKNVFKVAEQEVNDGNFPTVVSPNPEEPTAMKMVMELADKVGADIALGTDPDADRVGCAVRGNDGSLVLLNGNQTAALITNYMLTRWAEEGRLDGGQYVIKTIVTTELMTAICDKYNVRIYDVLTGFKNIASVMHANEGKTYFICGGEESNGFNAGEFVRDKDSIITCSLLCECAAWCADRGQSLYDYLQETYAEYGLYCEKGVSIMRKGKDGLAEIAGMMAEYRANPPKELAGSKVVKVIDYTFPEKTGLPYSNVLQFFSEDGCKVTVRPSGTEPKIKYYFATHGDNAKAKVEELFEQFRS
ncbi:MAG: phospho-sugar mutase [Bacteroidales bacterium]|nr:phospho-sugar mutase [Candidatus Cacconaster equifaecalis]